MAKTDLKSSSKNATSYVCLKELEGFAREKLHQMTFDYYAGGAGDELTLKDNVEAYDRIKLRPKMLVDVSQLNMSVELFGNRINSPVMIAPMAFHRLAHEDGEAAMARAAGRANTVMVVSTLATSSLEEVAEAANSPLWFQLYVYKDKKITVDLVERAEKAGYKAIVVTVDSPVLGRRFRDVRNLFHLPQNLKMGNLNETLQNIPETEHGSGLAAYISSLYDVSLTWKDLEWIAGLTKLPVLVKGVLRGDDTERAIDSGARGIVVSNHGGRQLDSTIATIDALPEVVKAAEGRVPILLDGGIRRGTDVLKALALGAKAVLVGRPLLWGLAINGEDGAYSVLEMLNDELKNALMLAGYPDVQAVTKDLIVPPARL
jgi:4-hydroxymandelate oxidase